MALGEAVGITGEAELDEQGDPEVVEPAHIPRRRHHGTREAVARRQELRPRARVGVDEHTGTSAT